MADESRRIAVIVEKTSNWKISPVTGAWGGPSTDGGTLVAHFYAEYAALPNHIDLELKEGEPLDMNSGQRIARGDFVREVQASFVMTPDRAVSIGKWLVAWGEKLAGGSENEENS